MNRALAVAFLAGSIVACQDQQDLAAPFTSGPLFAISDGHNDATQSHFFFLAPIRPLALQPPKTAPFNPNLSPAVEICEWNGTACVLPLISRLTMTDGLPLDRVYVLRELEEYAVLWRTANLGLNEAKTYRIRVLVGTQVLGFADVDVVRTLRQLAQVNRGEFVPLLRDLILPIRFRIEAGATSVPVAITLTPETETIGVFQTAQFTATVWDAQGLAVNLPITWTVGGAATVSASGLAKGVRTGTALVTASAGGLTATAELEVIGDDGLLSAGGRDGGYTCQIKNGTLYCWGGFFSLGGGAAGLRTLPEVVGGNLSFARVSVGGLACGVTHSGDAYCWYPYGSGSLVVPAVVPGGLTFLTVSAGLTHACGVTVDGSAFCWGSNGDGQLGNGTTTPSDAPVAVSGNLSFATVTTGEHHSCGVTSGGAAFCWGRNSSGQLGTGSTVPSNVPVAVVGGQRFAVLSTADADELGGHHTCGVTTDHAAYCWGSNGGGELGDGTTGLPHNAPVAVVGGLNFVTISARGAYSIGYTCGVTTTGGGYCWGSGPLGTDATVVRTTSATPAPVLGQLTFVTISAGAAQGGHTCGATSDGATYCWGGNFYGELGNGGTVPSPVPVPVMFP